MINSPPCDFDSHFLRKLTPFFTYFYYFSAFNSSVIYFKKRKKRTKKDEETQFPENGVLYDEILMKINVGGRWKSAKKKTKK